MKKCSIFILSLFLLSGCDKEKNDHQESLGSERQKNIDMGEDAIAKRWLSSMLKNPLENVVSISGSCVAWGQDGTCSYAVKLEPNVELNPRNTFTPLPCNKIYNSFSRFFPDASDSKKPDQITCKKYEKEGINQYIVRPTNENTYFIWESYVIQ